MAVSTTLLIVIVLIIGIWLLAGARRIRHKFFAIFLILLILFSYISFSVVLKDKEINFKSVEGITLAGKLYFSWLGSVFGNFKSITTNAIKMDWTSEDKLNNIDSTNKTKG